MRDRLSQALCAVLRAERGRLGTETPPTRFCARRSAHSASSLTHTCTRACMGAHAYTRGCTRVARPPPCAEAHGGGALGMVRPEVLSNHALCVCSRLLCTLDDCLIESANSSVARDSHAYVERAEQSGPYAHDVFLTVRFFTPARRSGCSHDDSARILADANALSLSRHTVHVIA